MEPVFRASSESERMEMARIIAKGKLRKRGERLTLEAIEREALKVALMICVGPYTAAGTSRSKAVEQEDPIESTATRTRGPDRKPR